MTLSKWIQDAVNELLLPEHQVKAPTAVPPQRRIVMRYAIITTLALALAGCHGNRDVLGDGRWDCFPEATPNFPVSCVVASEGGCCADSVAQFDDCDCELARP